MKYFHLPRQKKDQINFLLEIDLAESDMLYPVGKINFWK